MVKVFVGNLTRDVTTEDIRELFAQFGEINKCEKLHGKMFGFVQMSEDDAAHTAVRKLNKTDFKGSRITVEISKSKSKWKKIFVGNLNTRTTSGELRDLFESAGAKVVQIENCEGKRFGFVKIEINRGVQVQQLLSLLNGTNLNGNNIVVDLSEDEKRNLRNEPQHGGPSHQPYQNSYSTGNHRYDGDGLGFGSFHDGPNDYGYVGQGLRSQLQQLAGAAMERNDTKAEYEIYIGNYPGKFREEDLRDLFEDYEIQVGGIRMKNDGHKAFAFAEVDSVEMAEKAKAEMEGVEIQGRKLRVRSAKESKDVPDKKRREQRDSDSERDNYKSKKRRVEGEPLKKEDVTRHLVAAFVSFIEREMAREDQTEKIGEKIEAAKTNLNTAYSLPEDESLTVPMTIEDIFFHDVKNDIRAEYEIYIGNYPVNYREDDVRSLFEENGIKVGAIRMKYDSSNFHHSKVFAFAETESVEMVEKAKAEMEEMEIQGRKLRVRSSKGIEQKRKPIKKEEFTSHLVAAFVSFIERELSSDNRSYEDQTEQFRGLLDSAKTDLKTAYSLPEDDSLGLPRNIEDIFFRDVRNDIRIEKSEAGIATEIKEDGDQEGDSDGNWKRKGSIEEDEENYKHESNNDNEDN